MQDSLMNPGRLTQYLKVQTKYRLDHQEERYHEYKVQYDKLLFDLHHQLHASGDVTLTREQAEMLVHLLVRADYTQDALLGDVRADLRHLRSLEKNPWFKIACKIRSIFVK